MYGNIKQQYNMCNDFEISTSFVLYSIAVDIETFLFTCLICGFQHSLWSMITPKNVFFIDSFYFISYFIFHSISHFYFIFHV